MDDMRNRRIRSVRSQIAGQRVSTSIYSYTGFWDWQEIIPANRNRIAIGFSCQSLGVTLSPVPLETFETGLIYNNTDLREHFTFGDFGALVTSAWYAAAGMPASIFVYEVELVP